MTAFGDESAIEIKAVYLTLGNRAEVLGLLIAHIEGPEAAAIKPTYRAAVIEATVATLEAFASTARGANC